MAVTAPTRGTAVGGSGRPGRRNRGPGIWRLAMAVQLGLWLSGALAVSGQAAEVPTASPSPGQVDRATDTNAPPVPVAKSPVDAFRELLAMNAEERSTYLMGRSVEYRRRILAKIRDYEALKPEDRELRLQVTELRWYLLPLLSMPETNRAPYLLGIPEGQRKLIETRLQAWDRLSPDARTQLLANEAALNYLNSLSFATQEQQSAILRTLPPERRDKLQAQIRDWQALSEDQRQKILDHFREFFDLTPQEQARTLRTLSEAERQQIERTLQQFDRLPRSTRTECLRSFEKFATLNAEEQRQFLKNAERWSQMTPSERQAWKNLVYEMSPRPPPLPRAMPLMRPPPLPPDPVRQLPTLATNQAAGR